MNDQPGVQPLLGSKAVKAYFAPWRPSFAIAITEQIIETTAAKVMYIAAVYSNRLLEVQRINRGIALTSRSGNHLFPSAEIRFEIMVKAKKIR